MDDGGGGWSGCCQELPLLSLRVTQQPLDIIGPAEEATKGHSQEVSLIYGPTQVPLFLSPFLSSPSLSAHV